MLRSVDYEYNTSIPCFFLRDTKKKAVQATSVGNEGSSAAAGKQTPARGVICDLKSR